VSEEPAAAPAAREEVRRLFFAVLVPRPLQAAAAVVQRTLRRANADIKWVEPENLHFTLKFLGDTPVSAVPDLSQVAREVAARTPRVRVMLRGLGAFPHNQWPQVVWIGCDTGGEDLARLGQELDAALETAGLAPRDKKPFVPHLTLGRARSNRRLKPLIGILAQYAAVDVGPLLVTSIALMSSQLGPQGPTYTVIEEFPLRAEVASREWGGGASPPAPSPCGRGGIERADGQDHTG
jgi:2'-5' RNA ligase